MTFEMNPDFPRQLAEQVRRLQVAMESVSSGYSGKPVNEVREALIDSVRSVGNGASLTDPELTDVVTLISQGKRVWISDIGSIVAED